MAQVNPIQLKCPLCDSLLSIPADQQAEAITCEQCGGRVKVPRSPRPAPAEDDDDWLRLESDLPPTAAPPGGAAADSDFEDKGLEGKGFGSGGLEDQGFGRAGDDAGFDDEFRVPQQHDLPGARAGSPSSPGAASPPPLSPSDLAALGGFVDDPVEQAAPMKRVPPKPAADDSFRVHCPICDSLTYAKPAQVGRRIRCRDCHSPITVPPPPKVVPKYQPDLDAATVYKFRDADAGLDGPHPRAADPFRKSADEYLRAAEAAELEDTDDEWELPDLRQWLVAPVKIFRDPAVTIHGALLTLLAYLPAVIALQFESSVLVLGLFIGGAIFATAVISCGFAILKSVANGEPQVSEWPIFDPMEAINEMVLTIAAIAVAAGPALMLGMYWFNGGLVTVAMAMISLYVLFPVVILSMLDEQSILTPFSADVTKSLTRVADQWGAAYLCSAALFFGVFMLLMLSSLLPSTVGALVAIATAVFGTFTYFGIIGRLAYGIGHAINAPPMVNEIEREREEERARKSLQ